MKVKNIRYIENEINLDEGNRILCSSIIGTKDPLLIYKRADEICLSKTGRQIKKIISLEFSIGAAMGIVLEDNTKIFFKIMKTENIPELRSQLHFQKYLHKNNFPCPDVLSEPVDFCNGAAVLYQFIDTGKFRDTRSPKIRFEMARHLHILHKLSDKYSQKTGHANNLSCTKPYENNIWPKPHNALFDFSKNAIRSKWVDEKAERSLEIMRKYSKSDRMLITHTDWSSKHFKFLNNKVSVIYDWDSVKNTGELVSIANAASTYPYTWYIRMKTMTPRPGESKQFVNDYLKAGKKKLSADELAYISANCAYTIGYICKCKYSLDPNDAEISEEARILRTIKGGLYF